MALAENKKSIAVTVEIKDYEKLKDIAEKDNRSVSSLVGKLIKDFLTKKV